MFIMSVLCVLILSLVSASEVLDLEEIKVRPGQDVPLQCRGPSDAVVILLQWSRADLKSEGFVFFYRNERSYEPLQHPSFRGRVQLSDAEMKDGDVSVVLKNVTVNDSGTYECRVIINTRNETTQSEIKRFINLTVTDSGHTAGNTPAGGSMERNPTVVLSVIGGLLISVIIIIGCMICRKQNGVKEKPKNRPVEEKTDYRPV